MRPRRDRETLKESARERSRAKLLFARYHGVPETHSNKFEISSRGVLSILRLLRAREEGDALMRLHCPAGGPLLRCKRSFRTVAYAPYNFGSYNL